MTLSTAKPLSVACGLIAILGLAAIFFLYLERFDRPVAFYYGASPEVPQGRAFAILNPFRNRKDEVNAEWLIRDLRTNKCEEIVRARLAADSPSICPVLQRNAKASLIWLDADRSQHVWGRSRELFYDLPDSKSKLVVVFGNSEAGWGVNTVSILR